MDVMDVIIKVLAFIAVVIVSAVAVFAGFFVASIAWSIGSGLVA